MRRVTADEAAVHHVRPWAEGPRHAALLDHIRNLWDGEWCDIVLCGGCGSRSASPFVAGDARFYELAFGHTDRYPADKWEFQSALQAVAGDRGKIVENLRVLEFGAGRGAFLRHLIDAGVNPAGLAAVEYSDLARRSLRGLGLGHVGKEGLSSSAAPDSWLGSFDIVALFQVLEHLDQLDSKLLFLRSCLRSEGRVIIAVPNKARILFNEENGALLDQPPNHITCFSRDGLTALAERTGFHVTSWRVQPAKRLHEFGDFHLSRYLRKSQGQASLAARLFALKSRNRRRLAALAYLAVTAPAALPFLPRLREGMSVLAVLQPSDVGLPSSHRDRHGS